MPAPGRLLGKLPAVHDARTLQLARYVRPRLPLPPLSSDWTRKVSVWPMFLNDTIGDCAIAAPAHMTESWTAEATGAEAAITDAQVLTEYRAVSGYDPADPSSDAGCVLLDVMKRWRSVGLFGRKIGAFAHVTPTNSLLVRAGVYLFGGLDIGLLLPASAQEQTIWDVTDGPDGEVGSWGGHSVPILSYGRLGLSCITWGARQAMTWAFFRRYCDEAFAVLSPDFLDPATKRAPNGFDLAALQTDLLALH